MTPDQEARGYFARRSRLKWWEGLPWILAVAAFFVLPDYMAFGTQVLITIIFALSLDLVVGFAGVVTLGHAAYFGVGAFTVLFVAPAFSSFTGTKAFVILPSAVLMNRS